MKLFGSSKGDDEKHGHPADRVEDGYVGGRDKYAAEPTHTRGEREDIERVIAAYQKKKRKRRLTALIIIIVVLAAGFAVWSLWVKPPDVLGNDGPTVAAPDVSQPPDEEPPAVNTPQATETVYEAGRRHKYSFLIMGTDRVSENTDTIMVGMFDVENHKLNIVNIPRDTLANVSWPVKKVNTMLKNSEDPEELVSRYIRDLLGFEVDMWAVIDLEAFVQLVDCIGGVDYDVPFDMIYEDYEQDFNIRIYEGYQHLSGAEAIKVVRYRYSMDETGKIVGGFPDGDIGRINLQQDFLKSVASQVLQIGNVTKINDFAKIFEENVQTNLTGGNVVYLAQEFLKLSSEDMTFQTAPGNYYLSILNVSYCSLYLDEWLEMINTYLNPFDTEVTEENVNILRWDNLKGAYATTGKVAGGEYSFYDNTRN